MKTIIAAFCDRSGAQQAIERLRARRISDVELMSHQDGNLIQRLDAFNVPKDRAQIYAEVMRRGASLVVAHAEDDNATEIARDLDQLGSLDLDAAQKRWRSEGWNGYDNSALPYDAQACAGEQALLRSESMYDEGDLASQNLGIEQNLGERQGLAEGRDLEVIEEQVSIGKREVSRGGVRVRTVVVERPVHEEVQLREERIDIAREAVNERISPNAADSTFTEDEFVVTAQGEEAVVGKEARVVERVHVGKVAETRTESIDETERRRDVEVEPIEDPNLGRGRDIRRP